MPDDWERLFNETYYEQLTPGARKELDAERLEIMHVTFEQNSEEAPQSYFNAKLIEFTSSEVQIRLNFSDPLLVSQGSQSDQVKVRLKKSYFLQT